MSVVTIGISDMSVVTGNNSIITYALGSCIGVALYDSTRKIAGLAHILLPNSSGMRDGATNKQKFADTAIPELIKRMAEAGAPSYGLVAKLAGGAQMFAIQGASSMLNIGERNVEAARVLLKRHNIKIVAEDVGLNYGRTVELFAATGIYRIKAISKGIKDI